MNSYPLFQVSICAPKSKLRGNVFLFFLCALCWGLGALPTESAAAERTVESLEAVLREFDAKTEKIKGYTVDRRKEQMEIYAENLKKMLTRIAKQETECLNKMEGARHRLKTENLTKGERDLLTDHLNDLINNQYPMFAKERREIDQNRLKSNSSNEELRKEQEARLAGRAETRAALVAELEQARKAAVHQRSAMDPKLRQIAENLIVEARQIIAVEKAYVAELNAAIAHTKENILKNETSSETLIWTIPDGTKLNRDQYQKFATDGLDLLNRELVKNLSAIQQYELGISKLQETLAR